MNLFGANFGSSQKWRIHAVGAAVCIGVTLAGYLFGMAPLMKRVADINAQEKILEEHRRLADKIFTAQVTAKQNLKRVRQELEETSFKLKSVGQLNEHLAQLTGLATQSGVTLHEVQPGETIQSMLYQTVAIRMKGTGNYRTYAVFLHELHNRFPDTRVASFQLAASRGNSNTVANFTLNLVWHATSSKKIVAKSRP